MVERDGEQLWKGDHEFMNTRGVGGILELVTQSVSKLIKDTDMVLLYIYDDKQQVLRLGNGVGIVSSQLRHVAFSPGESITGSVYIRKEPLLFLEDKEVEEAMANISDRNRHYYLEGVANKKVYSSLSIPVMFQHKCIGTLTVNRCRANYPFTSQDMRVALELVQYGVLALEKEYEFRNYQLELKERQWRERTENYFKQVLLEGGDMNRVLDVLSRLLNGMNVKFSESLGEHSYYYSIVNQEIHHGWLLLQRQPNMREQHYIEEAAKTIAILLTFDSKKIDATLKKEAEYFIQMLQTAHQFDENFWGMTASKYVYALVFSKNSKYEVKQYRTLQSYIQSFESHWKLCKYKEVWVLYIGVNKERLSRLLNKLTTLQGMQVGVSRFAPLSEYRQLFQEAMDAFVSKTDKNVIHYDSLGYERLLMHLDEGQRTSFINDHLGPVIQLDSHYLETLQMLMSTNRNRKEAAEKLFIHPNTLYQRLKKIESAIGKSLDNEEDWLSVMIAMKLRSF
ncbi:helix-turn-helix domain-containing protein [Alkalihalobacillus sp. 1P02AB]|uniref:helix-turn-helix domain-containing protein n=1 Tax=Alkalihalobacillus sp. 1P02AB TaxID=3132260 RepID=UPI0039A75936